RRASRGHSQVAALPPADPPLVLLLEDVGRVQIEVRSRTPIFSAKLRVAAIAHGDIAETPVDDKINQCGKRENAVGDKVSTEPVEAGADERADDDDREAD